jgi:hypothetical protein
MATPQQLARSSQRYQLKSTAEQFGRERFVEASLREQFADGADPITTSSKIRIRATKRFQRAASAHIHNVNITDYYNQFFKSKYRMLIKNALLTRIGLSSRASIAK